jgi:5-methylcytosine-specific restriction endonuclease McrA
MIIKKCPKCGTEHSKPGIFCSRICANARVHSEETKKKISNSLVGKPAPKSHQARRENMDVDAWRIKVRHTRLVKYENTSFENLGMVNRRRRVFEEQNHCCAKCGISHWLGEPISLEMDHKDGNNENNSRDNLEGLCPNCHSLTDTWRGRNKPIRNGDNKVSDEELILSLKETSTIRQALLKVGMAAKGTNYVRAKRLAEQIENEKLIELDGN